MAGKKLIPHRIPLAFVDKTGYVTPFNGRIDETLSGWYIYDQKEVDMLLQQQRRLEEQRMVTDRGVIDVRYALSDNEIHELTELDNDDDDDTPIWAKDILGLENTAPYLQLANPANAPPTTVIPTATVDHFVESRDNVDLTNEQIAALGDEHMTPKEMLAKTFGANTKVRSKKEAAAAVVAQLSDD